jgi:predicted nucleotide-binding protein (sugar kinase/HSP70/actin superfamily)
MNLDFFLGMLNAMNIGDMLNEVGYMVRPYEVSEGSTDGAMEQIRETLAEALRVQKRARVEGAPRRALEKLGLATRADFAVKFAQQLRSDYYEDALARSRERLADIEVDRFRVKPVVKITGEFWAQTTEGDGNFNMFPFLEREGAEVLVEPIGTWIMYMIHQVKQRLRDRKGLDDGRDLEPAWWRVDQKLAREADYRRRMVKMSVAERIFKREYERLQRALGGGVLHELACQYHLQRVGHPYYNTRAGGGEGHLEVAKNIYYSSKGLAHMVLSLKPFGCMPSTQSDGAQAAVVEHYPDMIYLPIETSGEGEINAHSRVQMALGNARIRAREEFRDALASTGRSLDEMRAFVDDNAHLKSALYAVPKRSDVVGRAANFVLHVAELMDARGIRRAA